MKKNILIVVLAAALVAVAAEPNIVQNLKNSIGNKDLGTFKSPKEKEFSGPVKVSLRKVKNNPEKYEGEKVIITGNAAFDGSSIQDGGYSVTLKCSNYDYDWGTYQETKIYAVVEYIPGDIPLRLRCYKPPQRLK